MRSQKRRGEKKRWNRDKSTDKDTTSPTNAKRHAYPNTDQNAYNNLQQLISARHEMKQKRERGEKKCWSRDKPKRKHNTSHTNATGHAYRNEDQAAHNNLQQWYRRNVRSKKATWGEQQVRSATSPRTSTSQVKPMQHVRHTQMQTKPLTTTCTKLV